MSSLSNLPYGKILDYWYEKLSGNQFRAKFIATKAFEVFIFKKYSSKNSIKFEYKGFCEAKRNNVPHNPVFSLVIPAFVKNEKDLLDINNLFTSVEQQTQKPDSIIVVDDCSPIKYECPSDFTFHQLKNNSGPATARNIGKEIACQFGSNIIAFADIDCILNENWIEIIKKTFEKEKDFNILSGNTISFDDHWFGKYHNINGTLNGRVLKQTDRLLYGTTANLAITLEVAKVIDFNTRFPFAAGEDIDFCFRANKIGFAIKHVPTMIVKHNFGYSQSQYENFKKFKSLFKKYGQGEKILIREIPEYYAYFDRTQEIQAENTITK